MSEPTDRPVRRPALAPKPVAKPIARPERQVAFRLGISAESRAAAYLIAKGYRILARRWRSPAGEIDIIACTTAAPGLCRGEGA